MLKPRDGGEFRLIIAKEFSENIPGDFWSVDFSADWVAVPAFGLCAVGLLRLCLRPIGGPAQQLRLLSRNGAEAEARKAGFTAACPR